MADGRTHSRIAAGVAAVISMAAIPIGMTDPNVALSIVAGAVGGWMVTPDLDIEHRTHEEWRIWRLSPIVGAIWTLYWLPYAWAIPHRHWASHLPGVGTAGRMIYLFWWLPLIVSPIDWSLIAMVWCAWSIQDIGHYVADSF